MARDSADDDDDDNDERRSAGPRLTTATMLSVVNGTLPKAGVMRFAIRSCETEVAV
jgi:hypothetical protein